MQSKGKYKYSRYRGSPLRYAGGKSLAVGYILEHLPDDIDMIGSPFLGGGSVEMACANELGILVVASDIFDILTNYWYYQITDPESLADMLSQWEPTKEQYNIVKARLKKHWLGEERIDDGLDLAAHYWYNHNLSYGPGFLGWMSKVYADKKRYGRLVNRVRTFDCQHLAVSHDKFEDSIPRWPGMFLYCDPPYYLGEGSTVFKGIYPQRNFPIHHKGFNHELLRDLLHAHESGFVLSYNDCPKIRDWYSDFDIHEVQWQYTLGQGERRIGKNRIQNNIGSVKKSHELLIVKGV